MRYEARVEIETPTGATDEDALDDAFDKLVNSQAIDDAVMSSNQETIGVSYFVEAKNAPQAIDIGIKELLKALSCNGQNVVAAEARMEGDNSNELVSKSEIARRLKRSRERIRQLAHEGKLPPPVQVGKSGRNLYRWGDIERWQKSSAADLRAKTLR